MFGRAVAGERVNSLTEAASARDANPTTAINGRARAPVVRARARRNRGLLVGRVSVRAAIHGSHTCHYSHICNIYHARQSRRERSPPHSGVPGDQIVM
jgi:hypothetical protein